LDLPDERPAPYFITTDRATANRAQKAKDNEAALKEWQRDPTMRYKDFSSCSSEQEAVTKIIQRLDKMQAWNPQWWAINRQRIVTLLTRWCISNSFDRASNPEPRRLSASCFYQMGLYNAWEASLKRLGERTARDIEKSLRWDDSIPGYSGHGFETVSKYLQTQPK
jgi:hypothetical protein